MSRQQRSHCDCSQCSLIVTAQRITAPFLRFCTVSTDTLDTLVELCAGTNAITRIERARNTKLIKKLSRVLHPSPVRNERAPAVGGRVRDTASKKDFLGGVYRPRSDISPNDPAYVPPTGSGSLYGLAFVNSSSSRSGSSTNSASPPTQKSFATSRSEVSFHSIIVTHLAGRTNLSNRFRSSNQFDTENYSEASSGLDMFISDPTQSHITAQLAYERQKPENHSGDWVEEVEDLKVRKKAPRSRPSVLFRETRPGRRPVKFFGIGVVKTKENLNRDKKPVEKGIAEEITEDECAVESCDDDEDCNLEKITKQQKQRKRYHDCIDTSNL